LPDHRGKPTGRVAPVDIAARPPHVGAGLARDALVADLAFVGAGLARDAFAWAATSIESIAGKARSYGQCVVTPYAAKSRDSETSPRDEQPGFPCPVRRSPGRDETQRRRSAGARRLRPSGRAQRHPALPALRRPRLSLRGQSAVQGLAAVDPGTQQLAGVHAWTTAEGDLPPALRLLARGAG